MEQVNRNLKIAALTTKLNSKRYQRFFGIVAVLTGIILINRAGNMDTDFGKIGLVGIIVGIIFIILGFRRNAAIKAELKDLGEIS